ncbi:hypothetical protein HY624_01880, partial [Candidatus Uhrbacteria bacterium]|nr:hypothetical protein [Candidatus Uhrbacteria bacterium]
MAIDRTFFRGVEYEKKFTREYLVQRSDAPVTGVLRCAIPLRHLIILPTGKQYQADYIFPVKEWEAYEKYIARRFARRGGLRKMNEQYSNGRDRLRAALRGMVRARSRGLAAMQPFFKRYLDVTLSSYSEIYIQPWGYDAQFVPYVKERLTAAVDTDVMEQIWEAISLPRKIYAAQDAERAVYACYLRGTLKQAVFRITKKYCWLSVYNLNHEPVTPEYFLQFVKGKTKKQVAKEYARLSNLAQDNTRRVRAAFSNVRDRHFRSLLYDMNAYAFARTERIDTLKQSYYALTFFFEALRTQLSVVRRKDASFLDVVSFTTPEIIAFLEKRK